VVGFTVDLKVALGEGADGITINNVLVNRNLSVDVGGGTGNGIVVNGTGILGSASFFAKGGNDALTIQGSSVHVGRNLVASLGNGNNDFEMTASELTVGGNFKYAGGSGTDIVKDIASTLIIAKNLSVSAGKDLANVDFQPTNSLVLGGNVSISTGDHTSAVTTSVILSSGNDLRIHGNLAVSTAGGPDTVTIFPSARLFIDGNTAISTGNGADTVTIKGSFIVLEGAVSVKSTEADSFTLQSGSSAFVSGSLTYKGGTGEDNVGILGATIAGGVSISLAGGPAQDVQIDGAIGGGLSIKSASAAGETTSTTLKNLLVVGATSISLGASNDTIFVDQVEFVKATSIATGAGTDFFLMETLAENGQSFIDATFKVNLGAGDDKAQFGIGSANANNVVNSPVGVLISLDGSLGAADLFNRGLAFNNFGTPPFSVGFETTNG
jgi:hypothetical protein